MDALIRIKRLVIARNVEFTMKAETERLRDGLFIDDIFESILNANAVKKVLRSTSGNRRTKRDLLYVIESPTYNGTWIYTKGTIRHKGGQEVFYVFISAKLAT